MLFICYIDRVYNASGVFACVVLWVATVRSERERINLSYFQVCTYFAFLKISKYRKFKFWNTLDLEIHPDSDTIRLSHLAVLNLLEACIKHQKKFAFGNAGFSSFWILDFGKPKYRKLSCQNNQNAKIRISKNRPVEPSCRLVQS